MVWRKDITAPPMIQSTLEKEGLDVGEEWVMAKLLKMGELSGSLIFVTIMMFNI